MIKTIYTIPGPEGHSVFPGHQYGQAEIALRDALMFASGLPINGDMPTDVASLEAGYAARAKAEAAQQGAATPGSA